MAAWPTVGEEGRLALDLRLGLGCVETLGGRVCELDAPVDPGYAVPDPPCLNWRMNMEIV